MEIENVDVDDINRNKINAVIAQALNLEKKGDKKTALKTLADFVRLYPKSEAVRFHMGRIAVEVEKENKDDDD